MIRDKSRIYGEKNDPNTVIATGILNDNNLIVGAGNKGIKNLETSGKVLIWIKDGVVKQLPIVMANKILGTDENGNLVWLDI